jgi:hypothetical protein
LKAVGLVEMVRIVLRREGFGMDQTGPLPGGELAFVEAKDS